MRQHECIESLRAVDEEYRAATAAIAIALQLARRDPLVVVSHGIELYSLRLCQENLEPTYIVRLFAVFEEHVRELWASWGKKSHPRTQDLVNGCAARQRVDPRVVAGVHAVREYRNGIVHGDGRGAAAAIVLPAALSALCRYAGWMPLEW